MSDFAGHMWRSRQPAGSPRSRQTRWQTDENCPPPGMSGAVSDFAGHTQRARQAARQMPADDSPRRWRTRQQTDENWDPLQTNPFQNLSQNCGGDASTLSFRAVSLLFCDGDCCG